MAGLGDIATIGHIIKRAYSLIEGCRSAPEEIYLARDHIHAMAICLEGVVSDLYNNPRSFMHQTTDRALTRQHGLKICINSCDRSLQRAEALLKKFLGFKAQHVSLWERYKWSSSGKKEMADCKVDLVMATIALDTFLSKEHLNVLWKVESMLETFMKYMGAFEVYDRPAGSTSRPRRGSNIGCTLVVSLVLARLKKILASYRRRKLGFTRGPRQQGERRRRPLTRTPSGFRHNPQRNALMQSYASNIMNDSPPPPYTPHDVSPRPPSPDFYYISGSANAPMPGDLPRRSSSMQRLVGRLNAKGVAPTPKEHYDCCIIKSGSLAFGPRIAPVYIPHRRGQMQLRKMVEVFREAGRYDARAITEEDKRVRLLLKERNKKKGPGGRWYFAAGRIVARDSGGTGMVTVDKIVVLLVRRVQ